MTHDISVLDSAIVIEHKRMPIVVAECSCGWEAFARKGAPHGEEDVWAQVELHEKASR